MNNSFSIFTDDKIKFLTTKWLIMQRAKKVVSDNAGLVDFAIGLVN